MILRATVATVIPSDHASESTKDLVSGADHRRRHHYQDHPTLLPCPIVVKILSDIEVEPDPRITIFLYKQGDFRFYVSESECRSTWSTNVVLGQDSDMKQSMFRVGVPWGSFLALA